MELANDTATVQSDGTAEARIGPESAHGVWNVRRLATQLSGDSTNGQLRVYLDSVSPSTVIAGTYDGGNDTSPEDFDLRPGQVLIFRWTGVDPTGGTATAIVGYELRPRRQ